MSQKQNNDDLSSKKNNRALHLYLQEMTRLAHYHIKNLGSEQTKPLVNDTGIREDLDNYGHL